MTKEDPSVDETGPGGSVEVEEAAASPKDDVGGESGSSPDASEEASPGEEDSASDASEEDSEETPQDPAAAYKVALDSYLAGELGAALAVVDEVLAREPETDLRPRLERLRRRAEDRIAKGEPETKLEPQEAEEPDAGAEAPDAEEDSAAGGESAAAEASDAKGEASAAATDEPGEAEAGDESGETKAEDEPGEAKAEDESGEASAAATDESGEAKAEDESGEAKVKDESGETKVKDETSSSGRRIQKRTKPPSGKQQRQPPPRKGAKPPPPRRGGVQRRVSGAKATAGSPSLVAMKGDLDRMNNTLNRLSNSFRVVEGSVVKVAEAYQKVARNHKRKEQAYDQLYEELRGYKENFLLAAQKPLFKDIILLFDGVRRTLLTFEDTKGDDISREKVLDCLRHIQDEILEVLYRRDIELIEEKPDRLDINFQKPVQRVETEDPDEDRLVVQIVREGFKLDGAIMRPQEVVVKRCVKERESD